MSNNREIPHRPNIPPVYKPAEWEVADVAAVQACAEGTATPDQQMRAMKWIEYFAAAADDVEYRTDSRDHAFASGRRFVGLQVRKMRALNLATLRKAK